MKHLLSAADLTPGRRDRGPRHRRPRWRAAGRPRGQEAADAARPHRGEPVLRGLHPDPDLVRGGGQAAVRRRDQLLRQGLQRVQGREPQGHRADPAGDGRRRGGRSGTRPPARRTGWPTGSTAAWSTPATAPTSTRPRRCSTRTRCAAGSAGSTACRSPSSATCCTAGWPGPTCCCCTPSAPRSRWSRRRRCCRSGSTAWPADGLATTWTPSCPKADVVMMLRVQRERMTDSYFPSEREYARRYGLDRRPDAACCPSTRSSCTPAR